MWIRRHQVPIAPAFALTEYKVQGSTYRSAVLDLSRQSYVTLDTATYVQLSHLKERRHLWLLEPVKLSDLRNKMHHELVAEDHRIGGCDHAVGDGRLPSGCRRGCLQRRLTSLAFFHLPYAFPAISVLLFPLLYKVP